LPRHRHRSLPEHDTEQDDVERNNGQGDDALAANTTKHQRRRPTQDGLKSPAAAPIYLDLSKKANTLNMQDHPKLPARRRLILATVGLATATLPGIAAARIATPQQMRGPFYPDRMPLDQDNDLTRLMGGDPSQGEITDLSGRVLDLDGMPITDALVEIWQCDANGRYIHSGDKGGRPRDPGFQGYGKTHSGSDGGYRFRTIKPVPYPGRAPHIHVAVTAPHRKRLVTQVYVDGARENSRDFLRSLLSAEEQAAVTIPFRPSSDDARRLTARFDILMDRKYLSG
jgi:protocatechuate 3,4-dioxygenase beta subunit